MRSAMSTGWPGASSAFPARPQSPGEGRLPPRGQVKEFAQRTVDVVRVDTDEQRLGNFKSGALDDPLLVERPFARCRQAALGGGQHRLAEMAGSRAKRPAITAP